MKRTTNGDPVNQLNVNFCLVASNRRTESNQKADESADPSAGVHCRGVSCGAAYLRRLLAVV